MQLVSCIMPTSAARRSFIPLAVRYFLRQDYPHAELIIVDDSPQPQPGLIPALPSVIYIHVPRRFSTIGAKRNYACAQAHGSIILHWDDDDWYAPDWISRQVAALEDNNAGICGLSALHFFNPASRQCWLYTYNYDSRPWVAGATMAYRKTVWERYPFRDMQIGEDNDFVWQAGAKVLAHDYISGFLAILHSNNTSPKQTAGRYWKAVPPAVAQQMLDEEASLYDFCKGHAGLG